MAQGIVRVLKGLVVKIQFDQDMPDVNEMLYVENQKKTPLIVSSLAYMRSLKQQSAA